MGCAARSIVVLAIIGCKAKSAPPSSPEDAKKLVADFVAAANSCDKAALRAVVDIRAIAKRAGGDATFADLAEKEWLGSLCGTTKRRWTASATHAAARWEALSAQHDLVDRVGYLVFVAEGKPARAGNIAPPLLDWTMVSRLEWNWNEPIGDHPGRVGDTMGFALGGVSTASAHLLANLEPDVNAKARDESAEEQIEYGMKSWNNLAVEKAVAKVEAAVGRDPYLRNLVAAVHRPEPAQMLAAARETTREFPDLADGWVTQLYAEAITGEFDAAMKTLDVLVTKFRFDYRPLGQSLALGKFTASPAFVAKYPLR